MNVDLKALTQAVGDLDEGTVAQTLESFVASAPSGDEAQKVLKACQEGMAIVGDLFEKGEYFVGDLIFAGELLTSAIAILKPVLAEDKGDKTGKILLATVQGDLHDIGKNIFGGMADAAGFKIADLGIDVSAATIVAEMKEYKPDILGLSGVLTLALDSMKTTVDALIAAGLRDKVKIIIGGNPVTEESCAIIGADAFTKNAAEGVKICQEWVKGR